MSEDTEVTAELWRQLWLKKSSRQKRKTITYRDNHNQLNLHGANLTQMDEDRWGDDYQIKGEEAIRIGFQNIQGLPTFAGGVKNNLIGETIKEGQFDIMGFSELNLHWKNLDRFDGWSERLRNLSGGRKTIIAYNKDEITKEKHQYGGTAIIVYGDWAHRVTDTGKDAQNLGRWVWVQIRGKRGHTFRVICVYRPVDRTGEESVAEQHRRSYAKRGITKNQEQVFLDDLTTLIGEWERQGEKVIVLGDMNEDIRSGSVNQALQELGLVETITNIHGKSGPATQQRNRNRTPIDGIWSSANFTSDRAGYYEFGAGITSDHRLIWAEFDRRELMGIRIQNLVKLKARRLKYGDTNMVDMYNDEVDRIFNEKKIYQGMEQLRSVTAWDERHTKDLNRLIKLNMDIRLEVEEGLRKLRMGGVEWFPELQHKRDEIRLWLNIIKKRSGGKVSNKVLKRLENKVMIYETKAIPKQEIEMKLKQAFKEYKLLKKEAPEKREKFLEEVAAGRALRNNTSVESELKKMKEIERQRKLARKINSTRPKKQRTATIKVFSTDDYGERQECITKEDIETACIRENRARFTQCRNTPFLNEPLLSLVGLLAEEEAAEEILNGTFQAPINVSKYTKLLIDELKRPNNVEELPVTISDDENQWAWKRQKETISSVGLHFGHLKAASLHTKLNNFDAGMREIPYKHGLSPLEWRKIVDVEILKKAGVYDIEKMRTIQLMDSYFNMNNKKMGRDVMRYAESMDLIAKEQYGSRKKHRAVLAALNKRLTMDILRQKRKSGAIIINDAKSCYDRVVLAIASLSMRRLGAPKTAITSMCKTMWQAIHCVRTAYGDSQDTYQSSDSDAPLHGIGQGNGCAPTTWACVSTPIINMLRTAGFGVLFVAAMTLAVIQFVCYAFVDDTDLVHAAQDNEFHGEDLIPEIQDAINHWEGGLRTTGGALMTDRNKTYWLFFEFKWTKTGWKLANEEDVPGQISVVATSGEGRVQIARKPTNKGTQTLGVYISGDGSEKEEVEYLRDEVIKFADWMSKTNLTPYEINHAVKTTIFKTLEYPMEATCLTAKDWKKVTSNLFRVALPRMGVCQNYPRDVVYGPFETQGLNWNDPYIWQYLVHVKTIVNEEVSQTITSALLQTTMEQTKLELGMPGTLTETNPRAWEWTESRTWIRLTIKFMQEIEMKMHENIELEKSRIHDEFIMPIFLRRDYTKQQLFVLNCCRMNCKAITLSDLTTGDGRFIKPSSLAVEPDRNLQHNFEWPRRIPIGDNWKALWKDALIRCFNLQEINGKLRLPRPLGEWILEPKDWVMRYDGESVKVKHDEQWWRYRPTRRSRNNTRFFKERECEEPEYNDEFATGWIQRNILTFTGSSNLRRERTPKPTDPYEARRLLGSDEQWTIGQWVWPHNWEVISDTIKEGKAIAISDGSLKDNFGTSAFTIGNFTTQMIGVNVSPGETDDQESQRAEMAGVIGILTVLKILNNVSNIENGAITIGLDCLNVVKQLNTNEPPSADMADFDMYRCIEELIKMIPITIEWRWIEGHQDDHNEWAGLDEWARHNIFMDNTAKQYWNYAQEKNIRSYKGKLLGENRAIFWHGKKLTRIRVKELYQEQAKDVIGDYWIHKQQVSGRTFHMIDWEIMKKVTLQLPFQRRIWLSQQLTGMAGVNKWLNRWDSNEEHECPLCQSPFESTEHVIKCTDVRATDQWRDSLQYLREQLQEINTPEPILRDIIRGLDSWRNDRNIDPQEMDCPEVAQAQSEIGWRNFLYGRISHKWQEQFMKLEEATLNQSKRWTTAMVKKMMKVSWDQWQFRNAIKHSDDHPLVAAQKERVKEEIIEQFELGKDGLMNKDKARLNINKEDLFLKSLESQQKWVESMKIARQRRLDHNENQNDDTITRMGQFLSAWLRGT